MSFRRLNCIGSHKQTPYIKEKGLGFKVNGQTGKSK